MPVYLAITMRDAPALGAVRSARVWRGNYPSEEAAKDAAAEAFKLDSNDRQWLVLQSAVTPYKTIATHSRTSIPD